MAIKGQKFNHYPESLKIEAVRLHKEEGWSQQRIADHLGIKDRDRVKVWIRKFREGGYEAFKDRRGDPKRTETEQEREVRRLQMEVDVLKKWLQILNRGVHNTNTSSLIE
ncbi:transposase-like protein [Paenibacillus cellulosilyticus]|uniref:Transposase-like protein n=1 Tax=Paenibacillus cellulosilyticus TaxID=375489 RepID=A0A2V2YGD9_9BACL|nr:helix-turn-helix domain-containing protein [Paenibacillus cellulosilyticus]PWV91951.1 transposase-like protein [Paenibacillus cellulosilyticus]QKS46690.1 helix-turn-helix domain-containing protein [Paenibacillus cellulosilyticus]